MILFGFGVATDGSRSPYSETAGLVKRLTFGGWVLLQPQLLDNYCAWVAIAAREEPDGLGCICIAEQRVLTGEFSMDAERRLKNLDEERHILLATVEEVVGRGIAIRQPTPRGQMLVFPSEVRADAPDYPAKYVRAVTFRFEGPVQAIYATLAVSLLHSQAFTKKELYRNAAVFRAPDDQGLWFCRRLSRRRERRAGTADRLLWVLYR
jgi:hypothetical protein